MRTLILIVACVFSALADVITTVIALSNGLMELNPVVSAILLIENPLGVAIYVISKIVLVVLLITANNQQLLIIATLAQSVLATTNILQVIL